MSHKYVVMRVVPWAGIELQAVNVGLGPLVEARLEGSPVPGSIGFLPVFDLPEAANEWAETAYAGEPAGVAVLGTVEGGEG